ncbi:Phenylalanine--tRNA ligase alpha subunit [Maioricimonas rarisocia]|uniref:Phenylalanine--tRNA ligase alpha subunit n=1 Tax=Maioricimonas rarisocia TaxID=2528026 RepID=A0A517Z3N1_9PLAN|nr:phenylalanine--tRNA ligase subunit alpha [Maioricimonas rarisocia]QDU37104.1 Phenylalanine--tRNA ligase alpha subunit [Maioricimonas rarisocia]
MAVLDALTEYEQQALEAIQSAGDPQRIEEVRVEFLGKKKGRLKDLQSVLGKVTPEERPVVGRRFNEIKNRVQSAWEQKRDQLAKPAAAAEAIDVTLPGVSLPLGSRHPIAQTIDEFKEIMGRLGFSVADGPEIEDERHNFEALNIPLDHPARDPLDNFYLATAGRSSDRPLLLRSQTSTVQIRVMEQTAPPVRIVSLGRVYRPDAIDATHSCMFHQMEGLMVDRGITMADLKTVLRLFATAYFGDDVHVRFRPSFFPFTEPSVEVDMAWGDGWLEIGGAGMVDPNVLKAVGYDPEEVTGFAFGLGVERFAMRRFAISDERGIRHFYDNDVRFLQQF